MCPACVLERGPPRARETEGGSLRERESPGLRLVPAASSGPPSPGHLSTRGAGLLPSTQSRGAPGPPSSQPGREPGSSPCECGPQGPAHLGGGTTPLPVRVQSWELRKLNRPVVRASLCHRCLHLLMQGRVWSPAQESREVASLSLWAGRGVTGEVPPENPGWEPASEDQAGSPEPCVRVLPGPSKDASSPAEEACWPQGPADVMLLQRGVRTPEPGGAVETGCPSCWLDSCSQHASSIRPSQTRPHGWASASRDKLWVQQGGGACSVLQLDTGPAEAGLGGHVGNYFRNGRAQVLCSDG